MVSPAQKPEGTNAAMRQARKVASLSVSIISSSTDTYVLPGRLLQHGTLHVLRAIITSWAKSPYGPRDTPGNGTCFEPTLRYVCEEDPRREVRQAQLNASIAAVNTHAVQCRQQQYLTARLMAAASYTHTHTHRSAPSAGEQAQQQDGKIRSCTQCRRSFFRGTPWLIVLGIIILAAALITW